MKANITFKADPELWEEFKEKHGNASKAVRKLLREDLEKEEPKPEQIRLLEDAGLTPSQKLLAERILKSDLPIKTDRFAELARKDGLYSRRDHIKNAKKKLLQLDTIPLEMHDRKISSKNIECVCEANATAPVLKKNGWECIGCGVKYVF